jgi:hypothetical protein
LSRKYFFDQSIPKNRAVKFTKKRLMRNKTPTNRSADGEILIPGQEEMRDKIT